MNMKTNSSHVRVAVTQAEPEWLDLDASVTKVCRLMEEAALHGAKLVAFPECFIPGYPAWIWYGTRLSSCGIIILIFTTDHRSRPVDVDLSTTYIKNSLCRNSSQMHRIQACAKQYNIAVVLGFSENHNDSLYIAQSIIGSDGQIKVHRRKLKATHMERTMFGEATGNTLKNVVDIDDIGRVGTLACWEHTQCLLKYHTYLQNEAIHVSAWPPVFEHTDGPGLWSMSREGD
jgi:nitrilase